MGKTILGESGRNGLVEIEVTAAAVAALSTMTGVTPEWIDISEAVKSLKPTAEQTRAYTDEYVIGSPLAITDRDTRISAIELDLVLLWENGKAQYGSTGNFDLLLDYLRPAFKHTDADLQIPIRWSPAGGNTGDLMLASDATDTGIMSVPLPPTDEAAGGLIQIPVKFKTPDVVESVVV